MAQQGTSPGLGGRSRLCDFIRDNHLRILEEWERETRLLLELQDVSHARLLNHLPALLFLMAEVVETVHTGEERTLGEVPEEHALDRLDVGFELEQVSTEYMVLRACVLRLYGEHVGHTGLSDPSVMVREVVRFNRTFDEAVGAAVSRYTRARERTLVALDRISEAALGKEGVDTFLPKLLKVMLETTQVVDSVTLLLCEADTLRVRASVGLEEEAVSGFDLKVGEGFAGKIAQERRPLEVRSAATDPLVGSPALRARGIHALYGVPLLHGGELIGVAHMGSRTVFEFSKEDKLLFRTMVSRATGLLVQTQLAARERAAREEADERKRLLRLVIEQSGDAIVMADAQGVVRIFNAEAERLHGVSQTEVSAPGGAPPYSLLSVEGRPLRPEELPLARALQGETVAAARWLVRRPDGSLRTLSGTASPLRRPDGSSAGAVLTARDETERFHREVENAETLALLDTLLATAPVGLSFVDQALRYVRINNVLASINGVPVERTLGRTLREVLPELAPTLEPLYRHVLETGAPVLSQEVTGTTPGLGGGQGHWLVNYYPVWNRRGQVFMVGSVVVDITESKRKEEALHRAMEFRERFLGIVSHDLRNPLNAILLSANALMRSDCVVKQHLKVVRRITDSTERMSRMITDLLDFTRGRLGGGIPLNPRPANLRHLCRYVLEELESIHLARELRLSTKGNLQGEWDPDRLAQLLGNLGKNALDYSPEDTPVDFVLRDEGDIVCVEIHNAGEPIPEDQLPYIFEPFRRATEGEARATSGLGLGLYIVEQIAQAHGGTLSVRSTQEEGTTFTVQLPRNSRGSERTDGGPAGPPPGAHLV